MENYNFIFNAKKAEGFDVKICPRPQMQRREDLLNLIWKVIVLRQLFQMRIIGILSDKIMLKCGEF